MPTLPLNTVGILPVGALGAAFYYHLTRGCTEAQDRIQFIQRRGSVNTAAIAERGTLTISSDGKVHSIKASDACRSDLVSCGQAAWLPDVLLVCTQPDQLLPVVGDTGWRRCGEPPSVRRTTAKFGRLV